MVRAGRFELPASWSQTMRATDCAMPGYRYVKEVARPVGWDPGRAEVCAWRGRARRQRMAALSRCWWRRRESNPRPKQVSSKAFYMVRATYLCVLGSARVLPYPYTGYRIFWHVFQCPGVELPSVPGSRGSADPSNALDGLSRYRPRYVLGT